MKQFEYVEMTRPKRSAFDLSHERKTTFNMGELIPVLCHEVLPGDRFKIDFEAFLRTMPLISPVMHRVNLYAHAFFVPMRLLLADGVWEKYITQQTGAISSLPWITEDAFKTTGYLPKNGDLLDHLGYGIDTEARSYNATISQMPLRGYHQIWNDYYRDQNYQTAYDLKGLAQTLGSGAAALTELCTVRMRAWEKDYFTSSLGSPQRGNTVTLPIGDRAPVKGTGMRVPNTPINLVKASDASPAAAGNIKIGSTTQLQDSASAMLTLQDGLEADLTSATGSSISALRRAFALQRWYEASMRFGQRYIEQLKGLFGVISKDARLQRAEFLAGGKLPVQIGEVLQTSGTGISGSTVQGTMTGKGISAGQLFNTDRTFDEHGYIYVIVSALPRTSYATLALRQNFKLDVFDFAFPQLAHISEQPVYSGEIWNRETNTGARAAFGYQPIYSEYRYIPDSVHGDFLTTLAYWGLQRDFASKPALNEAFIKSNPSNAIFPVAFQNQQLILQSYAKILAFRPLPKFGTPV